jgi:hypothetical protein
MPIIIVINMDGATDIVQMTVPKVLVSLHVHIKTNGKYECYALTAS